MGIPELGAVLSPKWLATRNFHGQYYLDSDKLENYLHFRRDGLPYFYDCCLKEFGTAAAVSRAISHVPGGQRLVTRILRNKFEKLAHTEHGTLRFLDSDMAEHIEAFWGSRNAWEQLPDSLDEKKNSPDWDKVLLLDHGYDETKSESTLCLDDIKKAAKFRGGKCLSENMETGNWNQKLVFTCAFGHTFAASPRLVLEGGHWCPTCEHKSWNYGERAKRDPFFAQVWTPLHGAEECREYPKVVNFI